MASQLSGLRPNALERRKAISGLTLLLPMTSRLNVDGDTFNDAAAFRYVTLNGSFERRELLRCLDKSTTYQSQ